MNIKPKDTFPYFTFIYLGVCWLLCFNVILTSLNLYDQSYKIDFPDYSPSFLFPNMNFILNIVFQLYLILIGNKFSYYIQMLISLILIILALGALPFVGIFVSGSLGYSICCVLIALQGFGIAIFQSNLLGITGFLPSKFVLAASYGGGIAGICTGIIQYVILFSYGTENMDNPEIVVESSYYLYSISIAIFIVGLLLLILTFRHPWFINELANAGSTEFSKETVLEIQSTYFQSEASQKIEVIVVDQAQKEQSLEIKGVALGIQELQIKKSEPGSFPSNSCPENSKKKTEIKTIIPNDPNPTKQISDLTIEARFKVKKEDQPATVCQTFLTLMKKLYTLNILVFLVNFITLSVYPGLLFDIQF